MLKILTFLGLLLTALFAQAQSDLELIFEADDFIGGRPVNQSGLIRFTVVNHGPDDFFPSQNPIQLWGAYEYTVSDGNPYRFFSELNSDDTDCSLVVSNFDPPPPVNNYSRFMWGSISKAIPAQSTTECAFKVSIRQVALLDMQWELTQYDDPDMTNNSQQFSFRGLAASVPVDNYFALLLIISVLLITTWRYGPAKQS
ncbi:MAG: hypothetical protein ACK5L8_00515 [Marinicella pacifica]